MENIKQFLLQAGVSSKEVDFTTDKDGKDLVIEIVNFSDVMRIKEKDFRAAVFIKYLQSEEFCCIEMYQLPISKEKMDEAILRIKADPEKFKNL